MSNIHIIIPTYNRAHTIVESINSVIGQDYSDWKITIIDNNSSDGTEDVVKDKFKTLMGLKIIYKKFSKTLPIIQNWNRALNEVGDEKYFKLLWSDDTLESNFLSTALNQLEKLPENYVGFCSALNYIDLNTKHKFKVRKYGFYGAELWLSFFFKNALGSPTPQLLKTKFFKSFKFDTNNRYAADMIYAAEPYFLGKRFVYSSCPLANLQTSTQTETGQIYGSELMINNRYDFREFVIKKFKYLRPILKILSNFVYMAEKLFFKLRGRLLETK